MAQGEESPLQQDTLNQKEIEIIKLKAQLEKSDQQVEELKKTHCSADG